MSRPTQKIYIVEDDENIREIVVYALRSVGFDVTGFEAGAGFFSALLRQGPPDLVLLDIMLPEDDGLSILKRLRSEARTKALPVIMLTAKSDEYDKVTGLDMGADDYIAKPFGVLELISRAKAVLRRSGGATHAGGGSGEGEDRLEIGGLSLDNARREVRVDGTKVGLTFREHELLHYLMLNEGLALRRDKLLEAVWGYDYEGESRTVDMHIKSLRQKLGKGCTLIKTIRNVGYKLGD